MEIPGFSGSNAWSVRNGFLFEWYSKALAYLMASGLAHAIEKHWRVWNLCIYLRDVMWDLKTPHKISNTDEQFIGKGKVSTCLRVRDFLQGRLKAART